MYAWLWRHLPGRWPVRLLVALVLLAVVVFLLLFVIFPAIDPHLPFNKVNVTNGGGTAAP
ncbi:MAG TPA: hypothetical protein VHC41_07080 [Mycobacteriales bacterium]|jgi:hypothetical protein|nr:hypothetical protein [Mycobacteriales bacterium]